jgi:hypothetical protein
VEIVEGVGSDGSARHRTAGQGDPLRANSGISERRSWSGFGWQQIADDLRQKKWQTVRRNQLLTRDSSSLQFWRGNRLLLAQNVRERLSWIFICRTVPSC